METNGGEARTSTATVELSDSSNLAEANVLGDEVPSIEKQDRNETDNCENAANVIPLTKTQKRNRRKRRKKVQGDDNIMSVNGEHAMDNEEVATSDIVDFNDETEIPDPMMVLFCAAARNFACDPIINHKSANLMSVQLSQNNSCCYNSEVPVPLQIMTKSISDEVKIEDVTEVSDSMSKSGESEFISCETSPINDSISRSGESEFISCETSPINDLISKAAESEFKSYETSPIDDSNAKSGSSETLSNEDSNAKSGQSELEGSSEPSAENDSNRSESDAEMVSDDEISGLSELSSTNELEEAESELQISLAAFLKGNRLAKENKEKKEKKEKESKEDILRHNFYFLEKFDKFVYNPEKTTQRLLDLGLVATNNEPVSIEEALDSPIPPNFGSDEKDTDERSCHSYVIATKTATFHRKKIVIYTHLYPWIPDLEVMPGIGCTVECIYILHVYKDSFLPLNLTRRSDIGITPSNPVGPADEPQIQSDSKSVSKEVANLQWLRWLKSHQRADDFLANMKSHPDHYTEKYEVVKNPEKFLGKKNYRRCMLSLQGPHEGFAIPLSDEENDATNSSRIILRGRRSCGMAFDGDIVLVRVNKKDKSGEESGRVVGVLESTVKPVYQIFFCRVSQDQTTLMRPICGTVPKILVKNDRAMEAYEVDYLPRELQCYSFGNKHGMTTQDQEERQKREYAKKCMVSLYNPTKEKGQVTFEYNKSIKIQRLTCEKIFLVVYLNWNRFYWYPDGYVVAEISPNQSPIDDLALFRLQCLLPDSYTETNKEDKKCLKQAATIASRKIEQEIGTRKDFRNIVTFTIDNKDSQDLDDAISFEKSEKTNEFMVGIHITDVAHFLERGSVLDKAASQRAFSVYGIADCPTVHMLPNILAANYLSLIEGADRLCLAVLMRFDSKSNELKPYDHKKPEIFRSIIRSNCKLDKYLVSKCLHDSGEEIPAEVKDDVDNIPEEVKSSLKDIYPCTRIMRAGRMKIASRVIKPTRDLKEVGSCSKAENMIEELMVEANKRVAMFLKKKFPKRNLLRVHPAPDSLEVDDLIYKHNSQIQNSATVTQHLQFLGKEVEWADNNPPIYMTSDVVEAIEDARENRQFHLVYRLLAAEELHPFQMMIVRDWYCLMKTAQYVREGNQRSTTHYGLQTDAYTHFTSPLRRYCDIIVQRLLHAALSSRVLHLDLDAVADNCNDMRNRIRRYEKLKSRYQLFLDAQTEPLYLPCIVSDITSPHIVLDHHVISQLPIANRRFTHGQLSLEGFAFEEKILKCSWKQRLFIAKTEAIKCHKNLRNPFKRQVKPEIENVGKLYCFTRFDKPIRLTLPSLLEKKDTDRYWCQYVRNLKKQCVHNQDNKMEDVTSEVLQRPDIDGENVSQDGKPKEKKENKKEPKKIVIDSTVEFTVDIGLHRPLMAQFGAPAVRSARMLAPHLQYLQICKSFGICLEHRENPAFCFVDLFEDSIEETRSYDDITAYQKAWLPVLRLESVTEAMVEENSFYLSDVDIMWMTKKNKLAGAFFLEESFCKDSYRQIKLPNEGGRVSYANGLFADSDYLCIRVKLDKYVWIGHAGVIIKEFDKTLKMHTVYFEVHQQSNPFPLETASQRAATVEVIAKTMPKQKEEKALLGLANVHNALALNISLGSHAGLKVGMEVQCKFLKIIEEKRFTDSELRVNRCNKYQENAIRNAFLRPISIIWGPPGTGKTVTGVQMTYWYCKFNQKMDSRDDHPSDDSEDESDMDSDSSSETSEDEDDGFVVRQRKPRDPEFSNGDDFQFVAGKPKKKVWPKIITFPSIEEVVLKVPHVKLRRRKRQVLYCGPSNDCINCVTEHLRTKVNARGISILRVFSELVEYDEYKVPGKVKFSRFKQNVEIPENLREISLHRRIRLRGKKYATILKEFDKSFQRSQQYLDGHPDFTNTHLEQHKEFLKGLRKATLDYEKVLTSAKSLEVREHDIILCTTAVAANLTLQENCRYSQVIIDEAGMCTEPEALVPLVPVEGTDCASAAIRNVVLIGDHKQLSPIIQNNMAKELGLERSLLQRLLTKAQDNEVEIDNTYTMLKVQYRMHPSICEFPSARIYRNRLKTGESQAWSGLSRDEDIEYELKWQWNGMNPDLTAKFFYKNVLVNGNANVLHGEWPGRRVGGYECMYNRVPSPRYNEERVAFLHVEGTETFLTRTSEEGHENSRSNEAEVNEVVRIYNELRRRFSHPRMAIRSVAVLSQYNKQVTDIREAIASNLQQQEEGSGKISRLFRRKAERDPFKKKLEPYVSSVVRSQGSEFDYVILSTVRSLPPEDIEPNPTPGWEKKYLGFITDINQINVALTRARKGLIIIGNSKLLEVHSFWKSLLENLKARNCYVEDSRTFLRRTDVAHG